MAPTSLGAPAAREVAQPPSQDLAVQSPDVGGRPPRARIGFQLAFRTGYAVPMGKVADGAGGKMSDNFSGQVPILVEIGGKPSAHLFVAGYFGLGFGTVAGLTDRTCQAFNATCVGVTVRLGAELQYHFLPSGGANPWLGYGIGYEAAAQGISWPDHDETTTFSGWEFAHFMAGVDFRLTRGFGLGPFVDFSLGTYTNEQVKLNGNTSSGSIDQTAGHQWLTLGVRGVVFP